MADNLNVGIKITADAEQAQEQLGKTGQALDQIGEHGKTGAESLGQVSEKAQSAGESIRELAARAAEFAGIAVGAEAIKQLGELADQYDELSARIKLAVGDSGNAQAAFEAVKQIALDTERPLEDVADLYYQLSSAVKGLGLSQQQTLDLTKTLVQAVKLSGDAAAGAQGQIALLARGLADGSVSGRAFTSAVERIPALANAIADELGVSREELLALSQSGALSAQTLVTAVLGAQDKISAAAEQLPHTVGDAITNLKTQIVAFVGQLNESSGATKIVAEGIDLLANHLGVLAQVIETGAIVGLGKLAQATIERATSSVQAAQAAEQERQATLELAQVHATAAQAAADEAAANAATARSRLDAALAAQSEAQAALEAAQAARAEAAQKAEQAQLAAQAALALDQQSEAFAVAASAAAQLERAEAQLTAAQESVAQSAAAVTAAQERAASAETAAAAAAGRASAAQREYETTQRSATLAGQLLSGGIAGLVGNLAGLYAAWQVGTSIGGFLYDKFVELRYGADNLGTASQAAGEQTRQGMQAPLGAADTLLAKFGLLDDKTQKFANSAEQVGDKLKTLTVQQLGNFAQQAQAALDAANARLKSLTDTMNSLSDDAAVKFINASQAAFNAASKDAEQFGQVLELVRTAQLARLGIDAGVVRDGVDQAMKDAIAAVQGLGQISTTTAAEMTAAFNAALSRATTQEDAAALAQALSKVKVDGFDAAGAIEQIRQRMDELPLAAARLDPVEQALKRLGLESQQSLDRAAAAAKDDFSVVATSGTQSAGVVAQAFAKYADAALKAAAAQGDAQLQSAADALKAQAATQQESDALDALIKKYPQLADAAQQTAKVQVAAADAAISEYDKLRQAIAAAQDNDALVKAQNDLTDAFLHGQVAAQDYSAAMEAAKNKEEQLGSATTALANQVLGIRQQFLGVSQAAASAFDELVRLNTIQGEQVGTFIDNLNVAIGNLNRRISEQQSAVDDLLAQYNNGSITLSNFVWQAQQAVQSMQFLDQQRLSQLTSAIQTAKQALDSLEQSASQTLLDLQDQLDQLEGNTEAIQQRQNAIKEAQIQEQLAEARRAGDYQAIAQLEQALDTLHQIEQVQAEQAAAQRKQQQQQQQQQAQAPNTSAASGGRYEIALTINGQTVDVYTDTQAQAEALIAALEAAAKTSIKH